jgi:hypothetical protein
MFWLSLLVGLLLISYCLIQTYRDVCRRSWVFATWGFGMILCLSWIIEAMIRGPSY